MKKGPDSASQASIFNRLNEPKPEPVINGLVKLDVAEGLKLPMYARILTLEFHTRMTSPTQKASLRLELEPVRASHLRVQLWFENVRDITIPQLPSDGLICGQLQIDDARSAGWPDVNWKIYNAQAENLLFYAEKAEVVSVFMTG